MQKSYKVIILGDKGVGKTSFIDRNLYSMFDNQEGYTPTKEFESFPISFLTTNGKFKFFVNEYNFNCNNNNNESVNTREIVEFYKNVDCAIIMSDLTNKSFNERCNFWEQELLKNNCKNIPIIILGSKYDLVEEVNIELILDKKYFNISSKTGYNCEEPFLFLCQGFSNDINLKFLFYEFK
mgnify:CR=1 FL=1